MLHLVPDFQAELAVKFGEGINWTVQAVLSWSQEDCQTQQYCYRLKVKTANGEFLSKLTFLCLFGEEDRAKLTKFANEYRVHTDSMMGVPTLLSVEKDRQVLYEIQLYQSGGGRPKEKAQPLFSQPPLSMKSAKEKAYQGLDRKLRELYDSKEFRDLKSLYPDREPPQLLGQYIQVQYNLQKQMMSQMNEEMENQMNVGSPQSEPSRPYGGYNQLADPLYAYPGVEKKEEDDIMGPGSPRYEPRFEWSSAQSPQYVPQYEESGDEDTV